MADPCDTAITPTQQMASSCVGACLVSLFMTPLDVVKIRLQAQDMAMEKKCFLYSNGLMDHVLPRLNGDPPPVALHTAEEICNCKWYNRPKYFNGTFDAMVKISRLEGLSSLWSGLSPTLFLAIPTTVIYFTSYEQMRQALHDSSMLRSPTTSNDRREMVMSTAAGGMARAFSTTLVSPVEMVRTKMQSRKMNFWQVREALGVTLRHEGVLGLWKGYTATMLRDVPFSALYWPCYEYLKSFFLGKDKEARAKLPQAELFAGTFFSGALAGSVAATVTLPVDVIKTRRQIQMGEQELLQGTKGQRGPNVPGEVETLRSIVRSNGVGGLFVGLAPRILKIAPACAIMISSYEWCKRFFRTYNEQQYGRPDSSGFEEGLQ